MLPVFVNHRDGMLVLRAVQRTRVLSTSEGAFGRVTYPEVMEALRRMDRPEDFWDIVFQLLDMKLLELLPAARGDFKFQVLDVQEHDVEVFLHQNRAEVDGYKVVHRDDELLTRTYLEGLEEAKARAVFL